MADEQSRNVDADSIGKRQYRRSSPAFILFLIAVFVVAILVLLLMLLLDQSNVKRAVGAVAGTLLNLPQIIYWTRCYLRWHDYIEVDEVGILSVTRSTRHALYWNEISEIHEHRGMPDGHLELSAETGRSSIRVYYALKDFDELLMEIANRTQARSRPEVPHQYFGPEHPLRPMLRTVFLAFVFGVAGFAALATDHVDLQMVCFIIAGIFLFFAILRALLANTRTVISQGVVTVEKVLRSKSWALRDIEDVRIGLAPGNMKFIEIKLQLVGGRKKQVFIQGVDPVSLFNSLRAAIGSEGGGLVADGRSARESPQQAPATLSTRSTARADSNL